MLKFLRRFQILCLTLICSFYGFSQDTPGHEKPEMADAMRSNGKIFVVVAVLLIILAGLFVYLINTDRKLNRLEKNNK